MATRSLGNLPGPDLGHLSARGLPTADLPVRPAFQHHPPTPRPPRGHRRLAPACVGVRGDIAGGPPCLLLASCLQGPRVPAVSPPPLPLPALQPTRASASRERAIKPAPVPPGDRGGRRTCSGASRADLGRQVSSRQSGREKPDHAECAESVEAVLLPGLSAAPRPGTGEWRAPKLRLVTLP